jgi:hypothetical protein
LFKAAFKNEVADATQTAESFCMEYRAPSPRKRKFPFRDDREMGSSKQNYDFQIRPRSVGNSGAKKGIPTPLSIHSLSDGNFLDGSSNSPLSSIVPLAVEEMLKNLGVISPILRVPNPVPSAASFAGSQTTGYSLFPATAVALGLNIATDDSGMTDSPFYIRDSVKSISTDLASFGSILQAHTKSNDHPADNQKALRLPKVRETLLWSIYCRLLCALFSFSWKFCFENLVLCFICPKEF